MVASIPTDTVAHNEPAILRPGEKHIPTTLSYFDSVAVLKIGP